MKHLLVLIILLTAICETSAQIPHKWSRLKGPNVGNLATQLLWGSEGEIIAVSTLGYYISTNVGSTWDYRTIIESKPNGEILTGMFISADNTYYFYVSLYSSASDTNVVGIYKSTDQGYSWNHIVKKISVNQVIEGTDHSLFFNSNGYPDYIYESIDKGNSWVELPNLNIPYNSSMPLIGSSNKYLYFIYNGRPYRFSTDKQASADFSSGLPQYGTINFTMIDNTLFAYSDSCLYTSDGEQPWVALCSLKHIHSIIKKDGSTILAATQYNTSGNIGIFSSTNYGMSWDSIADISTLYNGSIYTYNYSKPDEILYQDPFALHLSKDRGNSWKDIGFPYAREMNVLVDDNNRIFITKYFDSTQLSTDNGLTWEMNNSGQYSTINQMTHGPGRSTLAVDYSMIISIFDTSSNRWHVESYLSTLLNLNSTVQLSSDKSKYVYLSAGTSIFRSDDTGFTWLDINAPNTGEYINSIEASTDGTLYFGALPVMYRSDDHGSSWTKLLPIHDIVRLTNIKTFGSTGVLLGTEGDGLWQSIDKGNSWTRIDGNNFDTVTCMTIDSKGFIAVGTYHGLWTFDPIVQQWTKVTLGNDANLQIGGLDIAGNDDIYVGTYGSSVWVGTTNYNAVEHTQVDKSIMTISPNPASDRITIDLKQPGEGPIKLEVYDILGRKVADLADGNYADDHQILYNISGLSNGIYTVMLSGSKSITQNIVVNH